MDIAQNKSFQRCYEGKKILITGNTGFKGSWLTKWLLLLGAKIIGYSNEYLTSPSIYEVLNIREQIEQYTRDINDYSELHNIIKNSRPDFIFHLAAQSLVSESFNNPYETIKTNTLGTVTLLEVLRKLNYKGTTILITSDKCYENDERIEGYNESDRIGGKDPYSGSKGAAEILISSYLRSFPNNEFTRKIGIARAGNVIGGGDWNPNRVIVDCINAWSLGKKVQIKNPGSTRPWQHVLEPISAYLLLGLKLSENIELSKEAFNFGPSGNNNLTVREIVNKSALKWEKCPGVDYLENYANPKLVEANLLSLDCSKANEKLGWCSTLDIEETINMTIEWYSNYYNDFQNIINFTENQIYLFNEKFKV